MSNSICEDCKYKNQCFRSDVRCNHDPSMYIPEPKVFRDDITHMIVFCPYYVEDEDNV